MLEAKGAKVGQKFPWIHQITTCKLIYHLLVISAHYQFNSVYTFSSDFLFLYDYEIILAIFKFFDRSFQDKLVHVIINILLFNLKNSQMIKIELNLVDLLPEFYNTQLLVAVEEVWTRVIRNR